MILKQAFIKLVNIWFGQDPSRKQYQLAEILGVSSQYLSRALIDDQGSISYKYVNKLMEMTDHAVIIYPGNYTKIVCLKSEDKVINNKGE